MTALVPSEHDEQKKLCQWLDAKRVGYFAIPNAARRNVRVAARLHAEGMRAGAPDLVLVKQANAKGVRCPVAVEMKRSKGGRLAPTQKTFHGELWAAGWIVVVAHGADEAIDRLTDLGF